MVTGERFCNGFFLQRSGFEQLRGMIGVVILSDAKDPCIASLRMTLL